MNDFDPLGFTPSYACEVEPEFPGNGDWGVPTCSFWREGPRQEPFRSTWGAPGVMRISRADGTQWVGCAAAGGFGFVSGAFGCPDPDELCLVVGGQVFVINVWRPEAYQPLIPDVCDVRHFPGLDLLLLASPTGLTAVGKDGLRWTTARLCLDELRLVAASPMGIVCSGSFLDRDERLVVAPEDGRLISGPVCPY